MNPLNRHTSRISIPTRIDRLFSMKHRLSNHRTSRIVNVRTSSARMNRRNLHRHGQWQRNSNRTSSAVPITTNRANNVNQVIAKVFEVGFNPVTLKMAIDHRLPSVFIHHWDQKVAFDAARLWYAPGFVCALSLWWFYTFYLDPNASRSESALWFCLILLCFRSRERKRNENLFLRVS